MLDNPFCHCIVYPGELLNSKEFLHLTMVEFVCLTSLAALQLLLQGEPPQLHLLSGLRHVAA